MNTSTMIAISAVLWGGGIAVTGQPAIGLLVVACHALYWRTHILEVKLNKLLDDRGIFVTGKDLS